MHGIQALTMIPDPRRRCGRHSPRFSLLAIVLIAAMHPQPPPQAGVERRGCAGRWSTVAVPPHARAAPSRS